MIWALLILFGFSLFALAAIVAFAPAEHDEELGHISYEEEGK